MDASTNGQGRPVKRRKLAGTTSYGTAPTEFTGYDKETMVFLIHNFADLQEKREKCIKTETIRACGHKWKLNIFPRGTEDSISTVEYSSIFLYCKSDNIETNPVIARVSIRTKTTVLTPSAYKYTKKTVGRGSENFKKREDIIQQDLNKQGTLTIEVEIEIATERQEVWSPNTSNINKDVMMKLYDSLEETSDVTFLVGPSKEEFQAHKCVLAVQARDLYELVVTEESSSSPKESKSRTTRSNAKSQNAIVLQDIDATAFEALLQFLYGMLPEMINAENDDDVDTDAHEDQAKLILFVADRFGCMDLKLHMESYLIRNALVPSKAAQLLLMADSHSLPLLKEACMNTYMANPQTVQQSEKGWKNLQESNKLLLELLNYATSGRKNYSSFINNGNGTMNDADEYDVRSLRERLEAYELDLDGSREMLLQRWKEYLSAQRGDDDVGANNSRS